MIECKKCGKKIPNGARFCQWCGFRQFNLAKGTRRANGRGTIDKAMGGSWRCTVNRYVHGKRYRKIKSGFERRRDAEAYMDTLLAELDAELGNATPDLCRCTVDELHSAWMQTKTYDKLGTSKRSHYKTAWNRLESIWDVRFTDLTLAQMQQLLNRSGLNYGPQKDMQVLLSHLYKFAIKNEMLETNRALLLELPDKPKSNRQAWTHEEIEKWWQAYHDGYQVARIILIMIYTGMRTGEVWQMKPENIHLNEQYMIGGIKTEAGKNRTIPIAENISPLVVESIKKARKGLMPWRAEKEFYDEYAETVKKIGVRHLDPYSCRHTAATALAEAGVAPSIIQSIMGHSSYEMTLHYTHISKEAKLDAINAVAQSVSPK